MHPAFSLSGVNPSGWTQWVRNILSLPQSPIGRMTEAAFSFTNTTLPSTTMLVANRFHLDSALSTQHHHTTIKKHCANLNSSFCAFLVRFEQILCNFSKFSYGKTAQNYNYLVVIAISSYHSLVDASSLLRQTALLVSLIRAALWLIL